MLPISRRIRPRGAAAACGLLVAALSAACAQRVDDPGAPLDGLHACPAVGPVVGVFTGRAATARTDDAADVQAFDTWTLSLNGTVRRVTDAGRHVGAVIAPDARTAYQLRSSGRVLGDSLEAPDVVERLDLASGRIEALVHLEGIVDLAVSADGRRLAAAHTVDADVHGVTVVDVASPGSPRALPPAADADASGFSAVNQVALSPDGSRVAYAQAIEAERHTVVQTLRIRDVETDADRVVYTAEGTDFFADVEWSADGSTVLAAVRTLQAGDTVESPPRFRTLRYDVAGGRATLDEGRAQDVTPLSPDGGRLLGVADAPSGSADWASVLVAWERRGGASDQLTIGRRAHGISVAACSYR
jgi:hypothetical protein